MRLVPCLTYAVPIVALVQSPVLHLGHPQLVKLVHHDVLGFQHPWRAKKQKQREIRVCSEYHGKKTEAVTFFAQARISGQTAVGGT